MNDRVRIYTFKEGLLSRVAHDLQLHVGQFSIGREGEEIVASFDAGSLVVDGAVSKGQLDEDELSRRDRDKIVETIGGEILRVRAHPRIEYRGRVGERDERQVRVEGELTMLGVRRPLSLTGTREGGRVRASFELRPSEWGIRPYKALAGAIRLQDRVRVEIDLDAEQLGLAPESSARS